MGFLDSSIGALELGTLCASVLYGIMTVQLLIYMERDFGDPLWLRVIVGIIWIIDTAHTLLIWGFLYSRTVTNYGVLVKLNQIHWTMPLSFPLLAINCSIIQVYTTNKVRVLSQRIVPVVFAFACVLSRCGFAFAIAILGLASPFHTYTEFMMHYEWLLETPLGINVLLDVSHMSILCFLLRQHKPESRTARKVVTKLVMYTIETGVITCLCAVAMLWASIAQYKMVALGVLFIYPKLYSSSFLASLNARLSLRQKYWQGHTTNARFTYSTSPLLRSCEDELRGSANKNEI